MIGKTTQQGLVLKFVIFMKIQDIKAEDYIFYYTKTKKYPTVCPIYLIKWPFFDWSKKYINVTKNPPIFLYMLKYIRYWSSRSLVAKLSPLLKLQESKVEIEKK